MMNKKTKLDIYIPDQVRHDKENIFLRPCLSIFRFKLIFPDLWGEILVCICLNSPDPLRLDVPSAFRNRSSRVI